MSEKSVTNVENTWLLRIITGMASFISILLIALFTMITKKLDEYDKFIAAANIKLGQHDTWINTFDNAQKRMEANLDQWIGNKIYALKPDEIKVKRENR